MTHSPIAIKRRQVLGDLYANCDAIDQVPVYLESPEGEMIGHVDEGLGHYADAYQFHLPEEICKKLATGHYTYAFDYDYSDPDAAQDRARRVKINLIVLTGRKVPTAAVSRSSKKAAAASEAPADENEASATESVVG